jgi:hypothetical protein
MFQPISGFVECAHSLIFALAGRYLPFQYLPNMILFFVDDLILRGTR